MTPHRATHNPIERLWVQLVITLIPIVITVAIVAWLVLSRKELEA